MNEAWTKIKSEIRTLARRNWHKAIFIPEKFLGPGIKPASGVSDRTGRVELTVDGMPITASAYCGFYRVEVSRKEGDKEVIPAGICYQVSEVQLQQITDGLSSTYMVCERNLNPDHYSDGVGPDDVGRDVGFDNDSCREAYHQPLADTPGVSLEDRFGSAHPGVWQAVMCDGSVHTLSFAIDVEVHRRFGNREDGEPVSTSEL